MIYPLDSEKNARPEPIAEGAFVPESVLVFVDDDGNQLGDDDLLFPDDGTNPNFTTQVVIPTFEADLPRIVNTCSDLAQNEHVWRKCTENVVHVVSQLMFEEDIVGNPGDSDPYDLELAFDHYHDGTESSKMRVIEKLFFHISTPVLVDAIIELCDRVFLGYEMVYICTESMRETEYFVKERVDFLTKVIGWGINRLDEYDITNIFDELLENMENDDGNDREYRESVTRAGGIVKPIMMALLTSKRLSAVAIVDILKDRLRYNLEGNDIIYNQFCIDEYFSVMKDHMTPDEYAEALEWGPERSDEESDDDSEESDESEEEESDDNI